MLIAFKITVPISHALRKNSLLLFNIQMKLQGNDVAGLTEILTRDNVWSTWKFFKYENIDISSWNTSENEAKKVDLFNLNILHLAVIMQRYECVCAITELANEKDCLNELLNAKVEAQPQKGYLPYSCKWYFDANVIHLAANFSEKSLYHFINKLKLNEEVLKELKDNCTNKAQFSPLHIAAVQQNAISTM